MCFFTFAACFALRTGCTTSSHVVKHTSTQMLSQYMTHSIWKVQWYGVDTRVMLLRASPDPRAAAAHCNNPSINLDFVLRDSSEESTDGAYEIILASSTRNESKCSNDSSTAGLAMRHQVHGRQVSSLQTGLFRASWVSLLKQPMLCEY